MKKLIIFIVFTFSWFCFGQIPTDSILKKARIGIYDNPDESLRVGNELLGKEKDPNKKIEIYLVISNAYVAKRNIDKSLKVLLKAKELLNEATTVELKINLVIYIAIQYQHMELFSKSFETLDETENYLSKIPNSSSKFSNLGKMYAIRGMIYKSQANPELALEKFFIAKKNFKQAKLSKVNLSNLSVVSYNIAYCFIEMNQYQNAKKYFIESASFAKKANAKSLEAFAYKGMADMYHLNNQHQESLKMLEDAEKMAENSGDLLLNEGIYKGMADNYLALNNLTEYQFYNKKFQDIRFERKQSELKSINSSIDNQTKEMQNKREIIASKYTKMNLVISAVFLILAGILIYLILKKRKANLAFKNKIRGIMLNE
ncbi:Tetratricopeptide repeat-containing protein [Algoriella xinjiangensis]|uniref:Tetratricopeptide repeat-containing protein n=1 Tax=Algoriella xinjiangensis TaxID=684065 RepID=A0A1I4WQF0_9FLAO|nr:tetratricopeptide repeat protein [Algoriella xinjiangensis]SFN15785.1 Tetratricopeptide repeat-containing protein [Algoriella xinjiangensis]VDH16750.1 Uncharacterised protein [Algoriella xinjiangensis]